MGEKLKILIVDDNELLCKNLLDILQFKGYEVNDVYDGFRGIEAVKHNKYDVVLMDVKMPGINGIETLKIMRTIIPNMIFIMITAFADDVFYKEGLQNCDFKVVQKPINMDKLLAVLEGIVV